MVSGVGFWIPVIAGKAIKGFIIGRAVGVGKTVDPPLDPVTVRVVVEDLKNINTNEESLNRIGS